MADNYFNHAIPLIYKNGNFKPFLETYVGSAKVPQSVSGYEGIGFPAPSYIWDMQVPDFEITELVTGTSPLQTQTSNSVGIIFEGDSGLPNSEKIISRTTLNTSRARVPTSAVLDVSTSERIAVGMMVKYSSIAGTSVVVGKRAARGFDFQVSNGLPRIFGRPASGGDVAAVILTPHVVDEWHYLIYVVDRDPGVELAKVITELGSADVDISGSGSFDSTSRIGWVTSNVGITEYAALAAWEGPDVALLTSTLAQTFLEEAGV